MRAELARLHERLGTTTVYVTHDQIEAMTLGQRVAVMRDGRVQQVDEPPVLYHDPANLFVAAFIGSPSMNLVEAVASNGTVEFGGFRIPLDPARRPAVADGDPVILGIRPESFEDAAFAEGGLPEIEVTVAVMEELGSDAHVIFELDAPRVEAEELRAAVEEGDEALLVDSGTTLFNARVDPRTQAKVGRALRLAVQPAGFHFFDRATGENLLLAAAAAA
jgi:multiple sugar transport system ATP-binding protein